MIKLQKEKFITINRVKKLVSPKRPQTKHTINRSILSEKYKGGTPAVGSYFITNPWIKPSFSCKSLSVSSISANVSRSSTPNTNKPVQGRLKKPQKRTITLLPIAQKRHRGVWEDVKLYESPRKLNNILRFETQKKNIEAHQTSISISLKKLEEFLYFH